MGNPGIWWGIMGLALPILLHFWHQKRGKELAWAATRWLKEISLQRSRGLRLDDIWLLLLRCVLLISLLLYLSRPFPLGEKEAQVHWVQADAKVVEAFRFELEQARSQGEELRWFGGEEVEDLTRIPESRNLQSGLNAWSGAATHQLYLRNDLGFAEVRPVFVPGDFRLHVFVDSAQQKAPPLPSSVRVFAEDKAVRAAVESIRAVKGLDITVDTVAGKSYDLKFLDEPDETTDLQVITGAWKRERDQELTRKNVIYLPDELNARNSALVYDAKLPEWILDQVQAKPLKRLSEEEMKANFRTKKNTAVPFEAKYLWVFLLLLMLERWWSIRKNA